MHDGLYRLVINNKMLCNFKHGEKHYASCLLKSVGISVCCFGFFLTLQEKIMISSVPAQY